MNSKYSVLMSVYFKEKPEYLSAAIQSMFDQTIPTDDFILVCDGSLTEDLDSVIEKFEKKYPTSFCVIRLKQNMGLGKALDIGLNACKYD